VISRLVLNLVVLDARVMLQMKILEILKWKQTH